MLGRRRASVIAWGRARHTRGVCVQRAGEAGETARHSVGIAEGACMQRAGEAGETAKGERRVAQLAAHGIQVAR